MTLPATLTTPGKNGAILSNYYDRNPLQLPQSYVATGVGPHTSTTRWTYTVPSNRKAIAQAGEVLAEINTVATTPSERKNLQQITPNGGAAIAVMAVAFITNTLGTVLLLPVSGDQALFAGDNYMATTLDGSIGGTVDYANTMSIVEFDA